MYSPVIVGPWAILDPFREISNRSNQLSLEQLKLPRGPEMELHGNNLTKDAEQNRGYRIGLENCVLSKTADHCSFRCSLQGSRQHLPVPFGPMYFCVIPSFGSEDRLPQVSSAHQPTRGKECWKVEKSKSNRNPGWRGDSILSTAARLRENVVEQSTRHSTTKTGGQSCAKAQGKFFGVEDPACRRRLATALLPRWTRRWASQGEWEVVRSELCCFMLLLHPASCCFMPLHPAPSATKGGSRDKTRTSGNYVV